MKGGATSRLEDCDKGARVVISSVLCALYLRGAPRSGGPPRRRWPLVLGALARSGCCSEDVAAVLRDAGLWDEAAAAEEASLMEWGVGVVTAGRALTAAMQDYPRGWLEALGSSAPPCVWAEGAVPGAKAVSVTGSRGPRANAKSVCVTVGREAMRLGCTLVSGGAVGIDSLAVQSALECGGAGRCIEILPYGLRHPEHSARRREGVCYLSACEPWVGFTTGQAMERNALIYSYGRRAVAVSPRLMQGGTWHGCADALRRRLCSLWVYGAGTAVEALVALGARRLDSGQNLCAVLESTVPDPQPDLFGANAVRERAQGSPSTRAARA